MNARYNIDFPDQLDEELTAIAIESESSKAVILRKAVAMFIAAHKATRNAPPSRHR